MQDLVYGLRRIPLPGTSVNSPALTFHQGGSPKLSLEMPEGVGEQRLLRIGEVAQITGFSTKALRYYDEAELVQPASRSEARYRLYGESELAQLEFIKRAKLIGLSLEEIKELLDLMATEGGQAKFLSRLEVILEARVLEIERQMIELSEFRANFQEFHFPDVG
jgi:MerR family copper efflux transcriptional regulator